MSRKVLCGVYATISLVALVATWSQNIVHVRGGGSFLGFFEALKVNPASRGITVGHLLVWSCGGDLDGYRGTQGRCQVRVGLHHRRVRNSDQRECFHYSCIARELRLEKSDATLLRPIDSILLALLAVATLAITLWVDLV